MNRIIYTSILLILFIFTEVQSNYYVSLSGNNNNSGISVESAWRTISYAVSSSSPVKAGDTIFIRAGDYGNENIVIEKNGTRKKPIVILGYKEKPGDSPFLEYKYGDTLNAKVMPLINGGDRTKGVGIDINGAANVNIQNIQITNYTSGIYTWSSSSNHLLLDNIIVMNVGDINDSYSGLGIGIIYADSNIVRNCIVVNSCAEGISIVANNNLIENCRVYCDEDMTEAASTDYYIVTEGNYNTFRACMIERVGNLEHIGHGMGLKGNCQHNLFEDCIAKDMKGGCFYVRHRGTKYNEFKNCVAIGTLDDVLGYLVRDGASYNQFNNCLSDSCTSGIYFMDTDEDDGAQYCGRHNTFNNCIIDKSIIAIGFSNYSEASPADSNLFANCIFNNGTYLFETNRENNNNKMLNCIVSNFKTLSTGSKELKFAYSYCDFFSNSFLLPAGTGNIAKNPLFINPKIGDFLLQKDSPCIDAGTANDAPLFDFIDTKRPQGKGFDIGAFEYKEINGIEKKTHNQTIIYPNPTTGKMYFNHQYSGKHYEIISSSGTLVISGIIESQSIDVSMLATGVYLIRIIDEYFYKTKMIKFIKN